MNRLSIRQIFPVAVLLVGLCLLAATPAHAGQLIEGMSSIKTYGIEFNDRIIGLVAVVGCENTEPPPGYMAGQEYWAWTAGVAWPRGFTLVPRRGIPDFDDYNWETFPHEHFDLSQMVPMPAVSPGPGDRFYRVQIQTRSGWVDQGWMWLINAAPRVQEWYGRNLVSDLVGIGTPIRFREEDAPPAGSVNVYLLIHKNE